MKIEYDESITNDFPIIKMVSQTQRDMKGIPDYLKSPGLQPRRLRVVGIGAGASGLLLAYKIQRNFDLVDLEIFEKNEGTKLSNCDFLDTNPHFLRQALAVLGGKSVSQRNASTSDQPKSREYSV